MRAAICGLLLLAVAGCAPVQITAPPRPVPEASGPQIVVRLAVTGQPARDLVESVGASCWLDGVVSGAAMIVNRQTGRIVIDGDTETLVAADFLPGERGISRLRLSGQSIGNPVLRDRLVETLDRAVRTGETRCPPLQS
ncbi:MAG: hypothetical protein AAF415_06435 [Pseudomonadota bacterium]